MCCECCLLGRAAQERGLSCDLTLAVGYQCGVVSRACCVDRLPNVDGKLTPGESKQTLEKENYFITTFSSSSLLPSSASEQIHTHVLMHSLNVFQNGRSAAFTGRRSEHRGPVQRWSLVHYCFNCTVLLYVTLIVPVVCPEAAGCAQRCLNGTCACLVGYKLKADRKACEGQCGSADTPSGVCEDHWQSLVCLRRHQRVSVGRPSLPAGRALHQHAGLIPLPEGGQLRDGLRAHRQQQVRRSDTHSRPGPAAFGKALWF